MSEGACSRDPGYVRMQATYASRIWSHHRWESTASDYHRTVFAGECMFQLLVLAIHTWHSTLGHLGSAVPSCISDLQSPVACSRDPHLAQHTWSCMLSSDNGTLGTAHLAQHTQHTWHSTVGSVGSQPRLHSRVLYSNPSGRTRSRQHRRAHEMSQGACSRDPVRSFYGSHLFNIM